MHPGATMPAQGLTRRRRTRLAWLFGLPSPMAEISAKTRRERKLIHIRAKNSEQAIRPNLFVLKVFGAPDRHVCSEPFLA
jgi:hypothetical protein